MGTTAPVGEGGDRSASTGVGSFSLKWVAPVASAAERRPTEPISYDPRAMSELELTKMRHRLWRSIGVGNVAELSEFSSK